MKKEKEEIISGEKKKKNNIKETGKKVKEKAKPKLKNTIRKATAIGAAGALIVTCLIPFGTHILSNSEKISAVNSEPAAVTMDISEFDADSGEETDSEESEEKKIGFFKRIKIAIYGFFGAIGLWIATKIPWKKIFTKKNLIIFLVILVVAFLVYYITPIFWQNCPWDNNGHIRIIINKLN